MRKNTRIICENEKSETVMPGSGGRSRPGSAVIMPRVGAENPILGRYHVRQELGKGAMGVVYLGKDPRIGCAVAIKTMALPKVMSIVARVAAALSYAHANSVVHHDVKPANIMTYSPKLPPCLVDIIIRRSPSSPRSATRPATKWRRRSRHARQGMGGDAAAKPDVADSGL